MATSGGLHEALAFFWILLALAILMSFPLALACFGLTAPDASAVSTRLYNRHLLAPRVAGFVTVLLPVALALGAVLMVLAGTVFHLGARCFEARTWEGSVSVWIYAKCAGMIPVVAAEALACAICTTGYLLTLLWPSARPAAGSVAGVGLVALGGVALMCGVVLFMAALVQGCTRSSRLPRERGVAAALAGVLLVTLMAFGILYGFWRRGPLGGMVAVSTSALAATILATVHHLTGGLSGGGSDR